MAEQTAISWCDHTWSPWYGCTQVSMGAQGACVGCYARFLSETRFGRVVFGGPGRGEGTRDVRAEAAWKLPLAWNRKGPAFVFPSLCDPFDNHPDLVEPRRRFFDLIRATPNLTWLLLTKRPGNIPSLFAETITPELRKAYAGPEHLGRSLWPRNAAIGCTVVTQVEAERDLPKLLHAKLGLKPAFAFVSLEPLLGPVDLSAWLPHTVAMTQPWANGNVRADFNRLDWVITGGETDQGPHKARLTHPDWLRAVRDQCAAAAVPYHHKQHGEWKPVCWMVDGESDDLYHPPPARDPEAIRRCKVEHTVMNRDGSLHPDPADTETYHAHHGSMLMFKVGPKRSGRLLDGALHDAMPKARADA